MNRRDLFKLLGGAAAGMVVVGMPKDSLTSVPQPLVHDGDDFVPMQGRFLDREVILTDNAFTVTLPPPKPLGRVISIKNKTTYDVVTVVSDGKGWFTV